MKITRTLTIVAANTLGWLGGMAAMSWTKAAGPRMAGCQIGDRKSWQVKLLNGAVGRPR